MRCDNCGKFTKLDDLIGCFGEDEEWTECVRCTCEANLEMAGKVRK